MIEAVVGVLIVLAINTVFLIFCMHVAGKWFGIDFGPLKPGIAKVMVFMLISSILDQWLGGIAFFPNIIIWTVGFKIAFDLDWNELFSFTIAYIIINWVLHFALAMLLLS